MRSLVSEQPNKNEDGKILIPTNVLASLAVVRDSGVINMADRKGIKELVPTEVGQWMDENPELYMEGFFIGFADSGENYPA